MRTDQRQLHSLASASSYIELLLVVALSPLLSLPAVCVCRMRRGAYIIAKIAVASLFGSGACLYNITAISVFCCFLLLIVSVEKFFCAELSWVQVL